MHSTALTALTVTIFNVWWGKRHFCADSAGAEKEEEQDKEKDLGTNRIGIVSSC